MKLLRLPATAEFVRFVLVGLLNTAIGYGVFVLATWKGGLAPAIANALGYAVALCVAYFLYRTFVFKQSHNARHRILVYGVNFFVAFALNQAVLILLVRFTDFPAYIAQIPAMVVYTVTFFLLNKFITFKSVSK